MKIHLNKTTLEAAEERISFLFDKFDDVIVGMSGGKDSTVCFWLCMNEATKRNRLPLPVMFLDQEGEWQGTVDFVAGIMERPDVKPFWFQIPFNMPNNASSKNTYVKCWDENDKDRWIHPKHPISIKENITGAVEFYDMFPAILKTYFPDKKACYVAGMRAEESPRRKMALTSVGKFEGITWAKKFNNKNHFTFYPIYDWSYTDVWKYIHDNGYEYNRVYDEMYRYGVPVRDMRISNVHHETALNSLIMMQDIEPQTWVRVAEKISGANTIKHLKKNSFQVPSELPYMFSDWKEYALHLAENMIEDPKNAKLFNDKWKSLAPLYDRGLMSEPFWRVMAHMVIRSDFADMTGLSNFITSAPVDTFRRYHYYPREKWRRGMGNPGAMKYLEISEQEDLMNYLLNSQARP